MRTASALRGQCVLLGMAYIVLNFVKASKDRHKSLNSEYATMSFLTSKNKCRYNDWNR